MGFIHKKTTIFFLTLLIMLNKGYSYLGVCSINYPSTAFYDCIVKNGYQNASILIDYTSN